jgi:hypothetical protein
MKEASENELNDLSPFLADLKKRQGGDPFKTPKFYFDNLTDKVLLEAKSANKMTVGTEKGTPQYKPLFERLKSLFAPNLQPKLAMAFASIALVIAGSWYAMTRKTEEIVTNSPQIAVNQLPNEPIIAPIGENKMIDLTPQNSVKKEAPKLEIGTKATDNLTQSEREIDSEKAPKLADTEGSLLKHPESGLTEEELESYLIDTAEEGDLDGSDNKF